MAVNAEAESEGSAASYGTPAYRWYVLLLLTVIYVLHSMDRSMPNILVEPVRHEFHLKDAQLGLFQGVGYSLGFIVTVMPMGYLSDRTNRRNFLAIILVVWSACTALGGLTRNFTQLWFTRIAVGAAESGGAPVILPLVSNIFPRGRQSMAVGLLYIGVPVGGLLASAAGGYIAQDYGWRAALLLAGIPGLIMAAVFFLTTKEPPRPAPAPGAAIEPPAKLGEVAAWLIGNPAILCLIMGSALIGLISITLAAWAGSFFIRIYGVSLKQAGFILGVTAMCIVLAPPVFGWLTDRLAPRFPLWPVTLTWVSSGLGIAMGLVWLFAPSLTVSIIASIAGNFIRSGYPPILYPFLMNRTPARLRGSVMSFIQLITNLIGFGIGPAFVGAISDYYGGEKAIRLALADALGLYLVIIALTVAGGLLLRRAGARGGAAALSA